MQEPSSAHVWCSGTPHVFAEFVHVLSKLDAILAGVAQRVAVRSAWNPPLHARGVETAVPSARKCRAECTLSDGHAECTREQAEHQSQSTVNRHLFLLSPGLLDLRRSTQISSLYNNYIFCTIYFTTHIQINCSAGATPAQGQASLCKVLEAQTILGNLLVGAGCM